jgi:L-malate glycosyltransferase
MRIAQIVTRRQRRGAEVFATQLSDGLVRGGHHVTVVGLYPPPEDALAPEGADVVDLGSARTGRLNFDRVRELAAVLTRIQPDLVQANGSDTLKYAVLAKMLSRARWPLVYRNISIASRWLRNPAHRLWGIWLARRLTHVVAVSEESRVDFVDTYRVAAGRITTIPIGVNVPPAPDRAAARRFLGEVTGLPDDARVLIHVGSFSPEKNHLWLIEAFDRVREQVPNAHLVLVGDGALMSEVQSQVRSRGLGEHVTILGSRPDAERLIGGADLLLLPSLIEGLPGVVLEAFAHAVPAVVTDVGSLREVVHHGSTGVVVAPHDLDAFVSGAVGLLADDERRIKMGAAARALVMEGYGMAKIVAEFEALHRRLTGKEGAAAVPPPTFSAAKSPGVRP